MGEGVRNPSAQVESPTDLLWETKNHEAEGTSACERNRKMDYLQSEVLSYSCLCLCP